jgi:signal transduction histidine kinase
MPHSANEALVEARPDVSDGSNVVEFPAREGYVGQDSLHDVVFALATADDLASAIPHLAEWLDRRSEVSRVEWWAMGDDGQGELVAAAGSPRGTRHNLPLGPAGVLVLHGARPDPEVESALLSLTPILRRRAAEERLTRTAMRLARRNETLEDFAALVAHELKAPLQEAIVAANPAPALEHALDLVDSLLETARKEGLEDGSSSTSDCLEAALSDLDLADAEVTSELPATFPLPPAPLRVILRNLLANAVAAGSRHIHVAAVQTAGFSQLVVEDDGVGLAGVALYAAGSGLGLSLCRRIASRFGGRLELAPRPSGGTRAKLELVGTAR